MKGLLFCDDCPARWMCEVKDSRCDVTKWAHEQAQAAPPLTQEQIDTVVRLLGFTPPPRPRGNGRGND